MLWGLMLMFSQVPHQTRNGLDKSFQGNQTDQDQLQLQFPYLEAKKLWYELYHIKSLTHTHSAQHALCCKYCQPISGFLDHGKLIPYFSLCHLAANVDHFHIANGEFSFHLCPGVTLCLFPHNLLFFCSQFLGSVDSGAFPSFTIYFSSPRSESTALSVTSMASNYAP